MPWRGASSCDHGTERAAHLDDAAWACQAHILLLAYAAEVMAGQSRRQQQSRWSAAAPAAEGHEQLRGPPSLHTAATPTPPHAHLA